MSLPAFSVLIPVYHKDDPDFFEQALLSIYCHQSVKPSELVILVDGPVGTQLSEIIHDWKDKYPKLVNVVHLINNIGLGGALSIGLENCKFDLVARMDSDDIAREDRFELQLALFEEDPSLTICGSNISEFIENPADVSGERRVPMSMKDVSKFAIFRNPINHPSVMFKRSDIIDAGGYLPMPCFEDYYLWVRCIMAGLKIRNIQQNLVLMRSGEPQLARRRGLHYVVHEWNFLRELRIIGFITAFQFIPILFVRVLTRLAPIFIVRNIYSVLRK